MRKKEKDRKPVCPLAKGRDESLGAPERDEILSDEKRHAKLAHTPYLQPDVVEDLEEILTRTGEKIGQTMREAGDLISESCDQVLDKISPYIDTVAQESGNFAQKMRSLWDRFRGAQ